jgi:hypothetical protein
MIMDSDTTDPFASVTLHVKIELAAEPVDTLAWTFVEKKVGAEIIKFPAVAPLEVSAGRIVHK